MIDWEGREERQSILVAILEGGDWADASVDFICVPLSVNLQEEEKKYDHYLTQRSDFNGKAGRLLAEYPYMNFDDWLIKYAGARKTNEKELYVISSY